MLAGKIHGVGHLRCEPPSAASGVIQIKDVHRAVEKERVRIRGPWGDTPVLASPPLPHVDAPAELQRSVHSITRSLGRPLSATSSRSAQRDTGGTLLLTKPPLDASDFVRSEGGWWCQRKPASAPEGRPQGGESKATFAGVAGAKVLSVHRRNMPVPGRH